MMKIKGFWPYLMLVFFNTFIDLGHKILIQDSLYQTTNGSTYTLLSSIINAFILLPYILLFTPSGFIADRFPKAGVLKITAAAAIPLTLIITWCYFKGYFLGAFLMTLLLATQSALNSPAKYGYIKELFGQEYLAQANALVQTLTIIAILSATVVFTSLFSWSLKAAGLEHSMDRVEIVRTFAPIGFLLILFSIFETVMTFRLVKNSAADPSSRYNPVHYFSGTYLKSYLGITRRPAIILGCIIGLSIFWAINQVLLASYGAYIKEHIGNTSIMFAQGSMAVAGIGILMGALYAGTVSRYFIESGLIPAAALGITVGLYLLPYLSSPIAIILLFLIYGFFGGMLIVPLNALIQHYAPRQESGKIQSANNFVQNCFMLGFLLLGMLSGACHIDSKILLNSLFYIALFGTVYTLITSAHALLRYSLSILLRRWYRIRIFQAQMLPEKGGVLLLGNHVSFIDWAILQIACSRPIRFVMDKSIYEKWYIKWLFQLFKVIPIAPGDSHEALCKINHALNAGEVVALFPEGQLTRTGRMNRFHSGFERAAMNADAVIIPFYLHGLWGSKLSRAKLSSKGKRQISVIFGSAMDILSKTTEVKQKVHQLITQIPQLSEQDYSNPNALVSN
ncbi:MFS transporter [Legionella norrlandica]|nr:MFS transporter [Legionella norrlandica]